MLKELLNEILLSESASISDVNAALDNHHRILINYVSKTKEIADGPRIIEVYAYGLTKAGNQVIRAFQPFGDTASNVPDWKFFRLDGITYWEDKNQVFTTPASDRYPGVGKFNPNDDKTMSMVYKIAKFDDTSTETGFERLKQQLDNPITINDLDRNRPKVVQTPEEPKSDVYRTPTEVGMERLRQQMLNPRKIDLSQFEKPKTKAKIQQDQQTDKERVDKVKDLIQQKEKFTKSELDQANTVEPKQEPVQTPEEPKSDVYRTPTEVGMDALRKQMQNPRKIDLSKIPKR